MLARTAIRCLKFLIPVFGEISLFQIGRGVIALYVFSNVTSLKECLTDLAAYPSVLRMVDTNSIGINSHVVYSQRRTHLNLGFCFSYS